MSTTNWLEWIFGDGSSSSTNDRKRELYKMDVLCGMGGNVPRVYNDKHTVTVENLKPEGDPISEIDGLLGLTNGDRPFNKKDFEKLKSELTDLESQIDRDINVEKNKTDKSRFTYLTFYKSFIKTIKSGVCAILILLAVVTYYKGPRDVLLTDSVNYNSTASNTLPSL